MYSHSIVQGVFNRTLRDVIAPDIHLLVDDGYNNGRNTFRADRFEGSENQKLQRELRTIVEISIGYAKSFNALSCRSKFSPELQEAVILLGYELSQLKMMMNPLRVDQLPEPVVEYLREILKPGIFEISTSHFINKISSL